MLKLSDLLLALLSALLFCLPATEATIGTGFHGDSKWRRASPVHFPANATGVKSFKTPTGVTIRFKEPGKAGICETTPGVGSYSGYIDLAPDVHVFFWFFESRSNPAKDPITLWLNGGPGSDSLIGLFQENGPCRVTPELETVLNPYSWNNVTNLLYLSQPVGTGFSYQEEEHGSLSSGTGTFLNASQATPDGTYPVLVPDDQGVIKTTDVAAVAAWHILQGFLSGLSTLDGKIGHGHTKDFNLWTESYGGHYGPAFFDFFYRQNAAIEAGKLDGFALNFNSLGIGNGIIDETTQAPWYPEFAVNNTYGIKAYNDTVYSYAKFAAFMRGGCLDQIQSCIFAAKGIKGGFINPRKGGRITNIAISNPSVATVCSEAQDMCRDNVEGPYYAYGGRGTYDIRHPSRDPTPPTAFIDYLNQAHVQEALGVSLNYTDANSDIFWGFQSTGDFVYPNFMSDLSRILTSGVRVSLYYGDADYICNWFGGQAVSLAVDYPEADKFRQAGYAPLMYGGTEYGEVRQHGNFSFTRVYEAGHEVPFYQPQAAFAVFNRSISRVDVAQGLHDITPNLDSKGPKSATHTEPPVALPVETGKAFAAYSRSILASYESVDLIPPPAATGKGHS